jgi:RNA polymerase subunit RPABC4/transcription elongation factor Spt4
MKARGYPIPGADLIQVATLVHADLTRGGFDVRIAPIAGGGLVVEIRRGQGLLQRSTGQGAVLKAWLTRTPIGFSVQVGTDRIGDAAAGAVEWLLATPALVTEGYAAFQQAQVDERVLRVVDHWAATVARVPVNRAPAQVPTAGACPACRTPVPYGARFCPKCGHDGESRDPPAACPGCKGAIALDALFCPHCGKKVSASSAAAAPETMGKFCVRCSAKLEGDAVFCSDCGTEQPGEPMKEKKP